MTARDAILARLGTTAPTPDPALLRNPERPAVTDPHAAFLDRLGQPGLGATHESIARLEDLPAAIVRYLAGHGLPPAIYLPPDGRLAACDWAGVSRHDHVAPDEAAALAIARRGIAETGSLVFETAPEAPMLPNFLALHHIVLLPRDAIFPFLEDAPLPGAQPRAHYWITGVSGTTDIEGSYVRGAHGPRFLHVILCPPWP